MQARTRYSLAEGLFLAGAIAAFLVFTLPNLANYPPPTDDEIWVLSSSYKLATQGVFGTDLFKGFWDADKYYLWNMPLHHIVLAGVFKVFGTSIFTGRLVGIVYGLATIVLVYVLARRIGGIAVAVLSVVLLLFLRLHVGFDTGLPLQETARSLRYDLAPVPFMLAATLILLRPTPWRAAIAGAILSLATLMQFYAAFLLPIAALYLLLDSGSLRHRLTMIAAAALASILLFIPYGVYVVAHYQDFKGQTSTLYRRTSLDQPSFYIESVKREYKRYHLPFETLSAALTKRPSEKAALFVAFPASLIFMAWRAMRFGRREDRLLFLTITRPAAGVRVLEYQKVTYYLIAIFPFAVIAIAMTAMAAFAALRPYLHAPMRAGPLRLAAAGVVAFLLLGFLAEGIEAQRVGLIDTKNATDYVGLRADLAKFVPPGSKVLGSTQLWWAMPKTDFRSYYMLYYRTNPLTTQNVTDVAGYLDEFGAQYVVLDAVARQFLGPVNPSLDRYLHDRADRIEYRRDKSFIFIEIWKIRR